MEEQDEEDEQDFLDEAHLTLKVHAQRRSHTADEDAEEDELSNQQDFLDEAPIASKQCVCGPPQTKDEDEDRDDDGLSNQRHPRRHRDDEDNEDSKDGAENPNKQPEPIYKAGPVPEEAKEAAFVLHQNYQQQMQELANQYKKPVKHFYQLVGQDSIKSRCLNPWNVFQAWYGVHGEPRSESGEYIVVLSTV